MEPLRRGGGRGDGNLYIADTSNHRIRKVDADTDFISTVAGDGTYGFGGDGAAATAAQLYSPQGVAMDGDGNLYIADTNNSLIRKVDADGDISTVAGNGTAGFGGDGAAATAAQLYSPYGVAVDGDGNLYIADTNNRRIRKVDADTDFISTVAGNGSYGHSGDGAAATAARLRSPRGVAVDGDGNLYIADSSSHRIRKVDADTDFISTVAGNGAGGFGGDGAAADAAQLNFPTGVAVDGDGNLYIADTDNHRIRKVDASSKNISTAAGASSGGEDGGPATQARLTTPSGVAVDGSGNVYIADTDNHRIRKVDADGNISTVAGDGTAGFDGDGAAADAAQLNFPTGVAVDGSGNLYIADTNNSRIRMVGTDDNISTVAGGGSGGDGGAATAARLGRPRGVAVDGSGNVYIADTDNHRIRKVDADTDFISTVAGSRYGGDSGDGGAATAAQLSYPYGVAVDGSGNLYIADTNNSRIRKVDAATNKISTVAGDGTYGFDGDGGPAVAAQLWTPYDVAVDGDGNLYIVDTNNLRIRKVDAVTGFISTVAGNGSYGFSGDGAAATAAQLSSRQGVAVDGDGNLYIADSFNHRIRKVDFTATVTPGPTATLTAAPATITAGQSSTLTVASVNAVSAVINPGSLSVTLDNTGAGSIDVSPDNDHHLHPHRHRRRQRHRYRYGRCHRHSRPHRYAHRCPADRHRRAVFHAHRRFDQRRQRGHSAGQPYRHSRQYGRRLGQRFPDNDHRVHPHRHRRQRLQR